MKMDKDAKQFLIFLIGVLCGEVISIFAILFARL